MTQDAANQRPLALVTGASRGIGKAIALTLKDAGYAVVGLYKSNDDAAADLTNQGIDMQRANVGSEADVIRAIDYADTHSSIHVPSTSSL